jgi:hypothetical protein
MAAGSFVGARRFGAQLAVDARFGFGAAFVFVR